LNVLALETSSEFCSVALMLGDELRLREERAGQRHSELLLPMVDALLNEAGKRLVDLSGIAFGSGPGSFTGVRIACGVAQGLAFGAGLPVAPVITLAALATAAGAPKVIACLDARMKEIYQAAYALQPAREGGMAAEWTQVLAPVLCNPQDAPTPEGEDWIGCGSGFDQYGAQLAARHGRALAGIRPGLHPHAREVAHLGAAMLGAGRGVAPDQAVPLYVRDKVALKMDERR
jgi:tRNA threonylcarbamoyladenosine biosynthesis protein TsaB